jgi:hypothetical protein
LQKNIDISKIILKSKDDYIFNILNIDNFNKENSHLRNYYSFIVKNDKKYQGNLYEFGVFKGKTLLATALLLKKINSRKKIIGFDSFAGFPRYHKNDKLFNLKKFNNIFKKHLILKKCLNFLNGNRINEKNISTSGDFSDVSLKELKKKIKFLKLNNIELIKGDFQKTIPHYFKNIQNIFSANIDSDLYESYNIVLKNIYPKLIKNGIIHLDEYYSLKFPGARIATDEFLKKNKNVKLKKIKRFDWEFERYYLQK